MMNTVKEQKSQSFKWAILIVIFIMQIVFGITIFQIGGLANQLLPAFNMNPGQIAIALSMPMLISAILGIPGGTLGDRYGVKRVVSIGMLVSITGVALRIGSNSFVTLLICMILLGVGNAFINSNAAKILGAWFPPQQMGLAMGFYISGAGVGTSIALATSPLFTIQNAFIFSAIAVTIIAIIWILVVKDKPAGAPDLPAQRMGDYLKVAAKSKHVWIGAIAMFFMMGTYVTQSGFMSNALIEGKGLEPSMAGLVASAMTFAFVAGGVLGPIIAARIGRNRFFLGPAAILCGVCAYLSWAVPLGGATLALLIATGFLLGSSVPLVMNLPMSLPEIGPVYAGSAGGIISTFQMAGAFFVSSYIIIPLAGSDTNALFLYISIFYVIFGVLGLFLPELGARAKLKKEAAARAKNSFN